MSDTPRTFKDGHAKLCAGRNYTCTCGYDDSVERELAAAQAKIDALMLEYCPEDMTEEQIANWECHQRPVREQGE